MTEPTAAGTKLYARRLPKQTSTCIRTTLENSLMERVKGIQAIPGFRIKDSRVPSTNLIIRRALHVYLLEVAKMSSEDLQSEALELLRLS